MVEFLLCRLRMRGLEALLGGKRGCASLMIGSGRTGNVSCLMDLTGGVVVQCLGYLIALTRIFLEPAS